MKRESETAQEAFNKYTDLVYKALEKSDMLVISLVILTKYPGLNRKIQEFNERLVYRFQGTPNIKIRRNSNFIQTVVCCIDYFKMQPNLIQVMESEY